MNATDELLESSILMMARINRRGRMWIANWGRMHTLAMGDRLVERETELARLQTLLDPEHGDRCWLISGEPGIGKTTLLRQFCQDAIEAGVLVLSARCSEDAGAPPWWPWTQVLRSMPSDALDLTEKAILKPILESPSAVPSEAPPIAIAHVGDHNRFQQFDCIGRLCERMSSERTLLVAIDDLHWSEELSLRLLEHLVGASGSTRVVFVGTYRDTDVSRRRPLGRLLNRIAADPAVRQMRLQGLSAHGTHDLMKSINDSDLHDDIIESIYRQTDGNPFFVTEVTRFLADTGYLSDDAPPLPSSVRIPEGIRDVVSQRLDRLSAFSNRLLESASVLGRAFDERILAGMIDDGSADEIASALDEVLDAQIIIESASGPGQYEFSHALMREAIYDEIGRAHRMHLHASAAHALESIPSGSDSRLAALANHWLESRAPDGAAHAADHFAEAAKRATAVLAYENAAAYYEQAIECLEIDRQSGTLREGELRLQLGDVWRRSGRVKAALNSFERVADIAENIDDAQLFARAALGYESARWRSGLLASGSHMRLEIALGRIPEEPSRLRVQLLASLATARSYAVNDSGRTKLAIQSIEAARKLIDDELLIDTLGAAYLGLRRDPSQAEYRLSCCREQLELASAKGDDVRIADAQSRLTLELLESVELEEFDRTLCAFEIVAERLREPHYLYQVGFTKAMRALLEGRYADGVAAAQRAQTIGAQIDGADAAGVYSMQMFTYFRDTGQLKRVAPLLSRVAEKDPASIWAPGMALLRLELGEIDQAGEEFNRFATRGFTGITADELWLTSMAFAAEVCAGLNDPQRADELFRHLEPYRSRLLLFGPCVVCYGPVDHYLGLLLATTGAKREASRFFESAIRQARAIEAAPWLARTCYDAVAMGCTLNPDTIEQPLNTAQSIARQLGMSVLVERCNELIGGTKIGTGIEALTKRECEVLTLLADGNSNKQIASALCVSPATVATHVRNLLGKTGSSNRTEVAALALREGLNTQLPHWR